MKFRIVLPLLLLATPALAEAPLNTNAFGAYLASQLASRAHDLTGMVDYTKAALKFDAKNNILAERLFLAQVLKGDMAQAEGLAPQVLKSNSQQRTARLVLGLKDFRNRRYADARANFNEAAYTPFGTLTSALLSAWSYAGENNLNAALKELEKLDAQPGFNSYKAFHTALITDFMGNGLRAEAAYKKAYDMASGSLRVVQAYGNFLERQGKKAEAEKVYQTYLVNDPGNVLLGRQLENLATAPKPPAFVATPNAGAGEVLFSVASALSGEQTGETAISYAQMALPLTSDRDFVLATLAGAQANMQDIESSTATYDQISKASPLRNFADMEIAVNQLRLGHKPESIDKLSQLVARAPKDVDALVTLGGAYRAAEQFSDAVSAYDKAISLMKGDEANFWRVLYDRGISYERLKQYDKSEADFRKALSLSKDDPQVLNYLGYSMIDRGVNLDEALGMVKKAVSLKPNDGYITDSLGWAYYTLKNYTDATTYCERAVDLIPSDPTIADHLGDVYWRGGRELEARFQWQHAIDNKPDPIDLLRIQAKLKDGLAPDGPAKPTDAAAPAEPAKKPNNG
jgi:tetratricopeptide (TPR) repeat protein